MNAELDFRLTEKNVCFGDFDHCAQREGQDIPQNGRK